MEQNNTLVDESSFVIEKTYQAPVSLVWRAITNKDDMKKWYFDIQKFKPEPGFEFQFTGKGRNGEKYVHLCKIAEVVFEKKLTYSWSYRDYPGMSFVTFELFKEGNNTRLKLTHQGVDTFPTHPDFAKESFAQGWTMLIGDLLKNYVEKSNSQ